MNNNKIGNTLLLCAALAFASGARAGVLDQSNPAAGNFYLNDFYDWQQQVTSGLTGTLTGIELYATIPFGGSSFPDQVSIALGSAGTSGPFLFTDSVTLSPSGTFIDTSGAGISLTSGESFVIDVHGVGGGVWLLGGGTYARGDLFYLYGTTWLDYSTSYPGGAGLGFETFVQPSSAVPEPSTYAMMLAGLGLLGVGSRRRRARLR